MLRLDGGAGFVRVVGRHDGPALRGASWLPSSRRQRGTTWPHRRRAELGVAACLVSLHFVNVISRPITAFLRRRRRALRHQPVHRRRYLAGGRR